MSDQNLLREAANLLVNADEAINACPDCFPDAYCLKHAEEWGQAMHKLRVALGRTGPDEAKDCQ